MRAPAASPGSGDHSVASPVSGDSEPSPRGPDLIQRLNAVPFSRWHVRARIVMGSATLFDAFDALSLAFVLPVLKDLWRLTPGQIGMLISAGYIGQFVGALFFGALAERVGRIRSATCAVALMSIMGVACALSGRYEYLLLFRFIQGIGVGGEVPVAAAYINEVSPPKARGRFFMLYEMIFPIGLMLTGQVGAWLVPTVGWQSMFIVGGIPGLLIAFFIARLPESPRWLVERGRIAEATAIVERVEASTPARCPVESTSPRATPRRKASWRDLLAPLYRQRTLVVWGLWFLTYLVANGLNNWLPTLYKTVYELDLKTALRAASLTNVVQVVATLACALLVDRVGRKNWASACYIGAALVFGVLAWFGGDSFLRTAVLATLAYGILGSTNVLLYLYTPEIYPTGNRAVGTGVATAWLRLGSTAGPALVAACVAFGGVSAVFWLFAGACTLALIVSRWMIETRQQSLEQIAS